MRNAWSLISRSANAAVNVLQSAYRNNARRRFRPNLESDPAEFPLQVFRDARCCFVISTGRCGTAMLTRLLATNSRLDVLHQPKPSLLYPSKLAYMAGAIGLKEQSSGILHARYELIRDSYVTGGMFIETNNRITFYAAALAAMFQCSTFIHLVRHPVDFVISALLRNYYSGGSADEGRIMPRDNDPLVSRWSDLSPVAKAGWLWNETNQEIESFKKSVPDDRSITVRSEDLFSLPSETGRIFQFLGSIPPREPFIKKMISRPVNAQQRHNSDIPNWDCWPDQWKEDLTDVVTLAQTYGYDLSCGAN